MIVFGRLLNFDDSFIGKCWRRILNFDMIVCCWERKLNFTQIYELFFLFFLKFDEFLKDEGGRMNFRKNLDFLIFFSIDFG